MRRVNDDDLERLDENLGETSNDAQNQGFGAEHRSVASSRTQGRARKTRIPVCCRTSHPWAMDGRVTFAQR